MTESATCEKMVDKTSINNEENDMLFNYNKILAISCEFDSSFNFTSSNQNY